MANYPKYEEDFYGWVMANAQFLKTGNLSELDLENLIEELISLGGNQYDQLVNRLAVLMAHLLKWQYQPNFRGRSWSGTLKEQRLRIKSVIRKNPSLKGKIEEAMKEDLNEALIKACIENNLDKAKQCIRAGALINAKDHEGWACIHYAVQMGFMELVKFLVEEGKADVNIQDDDGRTVLHIAVENQDLTMVKYLLEEAKVNPEIADNNGKTALQEAEEFGQE